MSAAAFESCPTCGAPVIVVSSGEGTSHYQPADDNDVGCELSRIESDQLEIHDALEVAGLPGAINAESILERIALLARRSEVSATVDVPPGKGMAVSRRLADGEVVPRV